MRIAVDAMGGDFGASPLVEGALWALKEKDFSLEIGRASCRERV